MKNKYLILFGFCSVLMGDTDQVVSEASEQDYTVVDETIYAIPCPTPAAQNGCGLFVTGSAIRWKADVNGLPIALTSQILTDVNIPVTGTVIQNLNQNVEHFTFPYQWGFQTGIGYNTPYEDWDAHLNWTRLYSHAKRHLTSASNVAIFPVWINAENFFFEAIPNQFSSFTVETLNSFWRLKLDLLDLDLGRHFCVGENLTLRPSIGFRGGWIRQKFDLNTFSSFGNTTMPPEIGPAIDVIKMKNNYHGLGLRGGLDSQWLLGWGFSLLGNGYLSLLYGEFDIALQDTADAVAPGPSTLIDHHSLVKLKDRFKATRAIAELFLGLSWDWHFADDQLHFGIDGGWDQRFFFGQNQLIRRYYASVSGFIAPPPGQQNMGLFGQNHGDLTVGGWTYSARLDF